MRKILALILTALLCAPLAYSQGGGGYPSRPRFSTVSVNTPHQAGWGSTTGHVDTFNGSYYSAPSYGTGVVLNGYYDGATWRCAASSGAPMPALAVENSLSAITFLQSTANCTAAAQAVTLVSWAIPKTSYGTLTSNTGTCTLSGSFSSSNITGCTWIATGKYALTFTNVYSLDAVCTATPQVGGSPIANELVEVNGITTSVGVDVYLAGVLADGVSVSVICNGT